MYTKEFFFIFIMLLPSVAILEILSTDGGIWKGNQHKGRFTRDVKEYELTVPSKLNSEGKFLSYSLPHFYKRDISTARERRSADDVNEIVHYGLAIGGQEYMLELYPNRRLMSPGLMVEKRSGGSLQDTNIHPANLEQCHYTGWIRGNRNTTRAAISLCQSGMVGYVKTSDGRRHFIEPILDHQPESDGQHLHMVYEDSQETRDRKKCDTGDEWETAWRERLTREGRRNLGPESSLKRDVERRLERVKHVLQHPDEKRNVHSEHRYLEILVVADKRFIEYHNDPDRENYILTIMNMANDFYHDASVGNLIDFVVVRIMYLEKEEEEIDLVISRDAEATLASFCEWQFTVNPKDISHPNHHDIAVLLTRYDICSDNVTECGLLGLANMARACEPEHSCCINEDNGLALGVVVTHEVGHILGCAHDEVDASGCDPYSDPEKLFAHVMSPYVQLATNKWSTCSRGFITEFVDSNLGSCLLDEPQEHAFKLPNMPPGAMYDIEWQCRQKFGPESKSCKRGPKETCEKLWCTMGESQRCGTYGKPPADGTKCGENMWCFERQCVDIGSRPNAVDGGWAEWGSYSECSRSCGGGVSISERDCTNPVPQNHGRYCTGERRRIRICNTSPCDIKQPGYRASQCAEYDSKVFRNKLHHWTPFKGESQTPCKLICCNEDSECRTLAPRAADGTPCKPGTRDMCIAGSCRKVGCDWVVDSDAVEDLCGICNGDGTGCEIVENTYRKQGGEDYEKIVTIPPEARKIFVEELEPSPNTIAVTDESGMDFYLNGDYFEEADGDRRIAGSVSIYTHPEPDKEMLVINGPLENSINLYVCFFDDYNPGVMYRYALPSKSEWNLGGEEETIPDVETPNSPDEEIKKISDIENSKIHDEEIPKIPDEESSDEGIQTECPKDIPSVETPFTAFKAATTSNSPLINSQNTVGGENTAHEPKFSWEFLEWGKCSVECGGGVQMMDASCIEEHSGRVSDSYCAHITKPEPRPRVCNLEPCKAHWRIGAWGHCQGCLFQTGCRTRHVSCVKQSPVEDLEVIAEDKECHGKKPPTMELCTPIRVCHHNISQTHKVVKPIHSYKSTSAYDKGRLLTYDLHQKSENGILAQSEEVPIKNDQSHAENENRIARTHRIGFNVPQHANNNYQNINSKLDADMAAYSWMVLNQPLNSLNRYSSRGTDSQQDKSNIESIYSAKEMQDLHANCRTNKRHTRKIKSNLVKHKTTNWYRSRNRQQKRYVPRGCKESTLKKRFRSTNEENVQHPLNKMNIRKPKCISNPLCKETCLKDSLNKTQTVKQNCGFKNKKNLHPPTHVHKRRAKLLSKRNDANKRHLQRCTKELKLQFVNNRRDGICNNKTHEKEYIKGSGAPEVTINKSAIGKTVIDKVPVEDFQIEEAPMTEETKKLDLSDEATGMLGDTVPDIINTKEASYLKGKQTEEVVKQLTHSETPKKKKNQNGKINA